MQCAWQAGEFASGEMTHRLSSSQRADPLEEANAGG